jgi:2-polyprenyl-6-methoxyphenol hydroxylase-like FAD-dependent oxidoreductase
MQEKGYRGGIMTFRNSSGTLLGRYWRGRKERYGFGQVLLPRAVVHEALLEDVPAAIVEWGKKALLVRETTEGVQVEFEDGNVEHADLVIGADGVKSVVREAIFGKEHQAEYE